jgi:2-polyprenyl-3-methyl-5-hydroxy-6-metoxy-1,4-benzoquinol methylase
MRHTSSFGLKWHVNQGVSGQLNDMRLRVREPELMDDPRIDRHAHVKALRGLTRIYRASRTCAAVWPWVRREACEAETPLRVLDIATGGGDLPVSIARRARREGFAVEIAGCDCSARAVAYARLQAQRAHCDVRFFTVDIHHQPLPTGYDVITSGLFLHHLAEPDAVTLLRRMANAAERAVLVDDLRRSRIGLWLARLATCALSRSPVVHVDGPRSVRAAFTTSEMADLAAQADLQDATIVPHWPERHLLVWRRV